MIRFTGSKMLYLFFALLVKDRVIAINQNIVGNILLA
jgi:hypothetical protein